MTYLDLPFKEYLKPPSDKQVEKYSDVEMYQKELQHINAYVLLDDTIVHAVESCVEAVMELLNKNRKLRDINTYKSVFYKMFLELLKLKEKYNIQNAVLDDIMLQIDLMVAIVGLCKGDLEKIEVIAQRLGVFDNQKVKLFINIIKRFKEDMFGYGITGLPSMTSINSKVRSLNSKGKHMAKQFTKEGISYARDELDRKVKGVGNAAEKAMNQGLDAMGNVPGLDKRAVSSFMSTSK